MLGMHRKSITRGRELPVDRATIGSVVIVGILRGTNTQEPDTVPIWYKRVAGSYMTTVDPSAISVEKRKIIPALERQPNTRYWGIRAGLKSSCRTAI